MDDTRAHGMNRDAQNKPFKYAKVLTEHRKELPLTILLVHSAPHEVKIAPEQSKLESICFKRVINNIACQILEFPTLCTSLDTFTMDLARIEEMRTQMSAVQYIWFATRLDATEISVNEQNVIQLLSTILGEQAWSNALLVLTHNRKTLPLRCASMMKKRSEIVRAEIARYAGWDSARSITAVTVGGLDELLLGDLDPWCELHPASSPQKVTRTVPWQAGRYQDRTSGEIPQRLNVLTMCYLWSGPAGALGMCLWGAPGFGIGLAVNALFWAIIGWLRGAKEA